MNDQKASLEREVEELNRQLAAKQDEIAKLENEETADEHIVPATS